MCRNPLPWKPCNKTTTEIHPPLNGRPRRTPKGGMAHPAACIYTLARCAWWHESFGYSFSQCLFSMCDLCFCFVSSLCSADASAWNILFTTILHLIEVAASNIGNTYVLKIQPFLAFYHDMWYTISWRGVRLYFLRKSPSVTRVLVSDLFVYSVSHLLHDFYAYSKSGTYTVGTV